MSVSVGTQARVRSELYVATNLETWEAKPPIRADQDDICERCAFRRLDPEYYAWLRSRMTLAQKRHRAGRLPADQYQGLRAAFNAVHTWAVDRFGESALLEAMRGLDPRAYEPPRIRLPDEDEGSSPEPAPYLYPAEGAWRFTEPVSPEAVAKVDAIREQALALGWSEAQLYQNRGRFCFPGGQEYGLVCYLRPDDQIGEVTLQFIETITARGGHLRFPNHNVDQPWLKHIRPPGPQEDSSDTSADAPVSNQGGA